MINSLFALCVFIFFCYVLAYSIIDRLCRCFETRARMKAAGQLGNNYAINITELMEKLDELG